jgi:hypothetical protein
MAAAFELVTAHGSGGRGQGGGGGGDQLHALLHFCPGILLADSACFSARVLRLFYICAANIGLAGQSTAPAEANAGSRTSAADKTSIHTSDHSGCWSSFVCIAKVCRCLAHAA